MMTNCVQITECEQLSEAVHATKLVPAEYVAGALLVMNTLPQPPVVVALPKTNPVEHWLVTSDGQLIANAAFVQEAQLASQYPATHRGGGLPCKRPVPPAVPVASAVVVPLPSEKFHNRSVALSSTKHRSGV